MKYLLLFSSIFLVISCSTSRKLALRLFQEKSKDWVQEGDATWLFDQSTITGEIEEGAGFIMTAEKYANFELELEFFPDSTINSGVFIRCQEVALSVEKCHEINIWDLHPNQENRTGAIVGKFKPLAKVNTLNRWNTYRIECKGAMVKIWVNGQLTAEYEDPTLKEGYIGLQAAGKGTIKFRNVRLVPR